MALGFAIGSASGGGGDFLPVVKFDARSGRISKVDRAQGMDPVVTELKAFKAILDMDNLECGWMHFAAGQAPDMRLVKLGDVWPDQPTTDHKRGIRAVVKLSKENGGDLREMCGNSASFLRGFDNLHTEYLEGKDKHPGKLPVIILQDTLAVVSKGKSMSSTNYEPVFQIAAWVDRPSDFVPNLRGGAAAPVARAAPPSTGSTPVAAPKAAPALVDADEDF